MEERGMGLNNGRQTFACAGQQTQEERDHSLFAHENPGNGLEQAPWETKRNDNDRLLICQSSLSGPSKKHNSSVETFSTTESLSTVHVPRYLVVRRGITGTWPRHSRLSFLLLMSPLQEKKLTAKRCMIARQGPVIFPAQQASSRTRAWTRGHAATWSAHEATGRHVGEIKSKHCAWS